MYLLFPYRRGFVGKWNRGHKLKHRNSSENYQMVKLILQFELIFSTGSYNFLINMKWDLVCITVYEGFPHAFIFRYVCKNIKDFMKNSLV